jgi:hypothetical protein
VTGSSTDAIEVEVIDTMLLNARESRSVGEL